MSGPSRTSPPSAGSTVSHNGVTVTNPNLVDVTEADLSALLDGRYALAPTGVKTAPYTAARGDLVPVDLSGGSVTITLPAAPADKSQVAIKVIAVAGSSSCTIARGGSDVFNKAGGSTSLSLSVLNQAAVLQYKASTAVWYVVSTDVPISALDTRYTAPGVVGRSVPTLSVKSRDVLVLDNSVTARSNLAGIEQVVYDAATGLFWAIYNATDGSAVQTVRFANSSSEDGPFADVGAVTGLPSQFDAPCIVRDGPNWYVFGAIAGTGNTIHCWKSTTGINGTYSDLGSVIPVGTTGAWDVNRTFEPWVMRNPLGTGWLMFYMGFDTGNAHEQIGIATATTIEGSWTKAAGNPVITNAGTYPTGGRDVDGEAAADPFALFIGKTLYIFYNACPTGLLTGGGNGFGNIALATTTDLTTFTKQGVVFEAGNLVAGTPANTVWRGSMRWGNDGLIRFYYQGRSQKAGPTQTYLAVIDPEPLVQGAIPTNPWKRVEAEATDTRLVKTGTWTTVTATAAWSNASALWSSTAGDRFAFYFEGTGARWGTGRRNSFGRANVYLNGVQVATNVDLFATGETQINKVVGYEVTGLKPGYHKLEIECVGSHNAGSTGDFIYADYFEYLPAGGA